jgi:hypothetical protein
MISLQLLIVSEYLSSHRYSSYSSSRIPNHTLYFTMAALAKNLHNTYTAPSHPYLKPIIICGIVMALSSRREVISPGSPLYDYGLVGSPTALTAAVWIQNGLFYFLFGAHAIETAMFARRLSAHGVGLFSAAWFKWMATCFVGGKFCFDHFDRVVGKGKA